MNNNRKIWIVSNKPATTNYGPSQESFNEFQFKEEIDVQKLKSMVTEFTKDIADVFEEVDSSKSKFSLDTIELSAVMAADGKLGILGSSVGAKIEGSIKFVLKRKKTTKRQQRI